MRKTMNNETRIKKIIRMINNEGHTWEEISVKMELSVPYLRKLVRGYYSTEKRYNNLLKKARENKKAKNVVAESTQNNTEEILLMDTGYLMEHGTSALNQKLKIFVPSFCLKELDKLSNKHSVAKELLLYIYSTDAVKTTDLKGREFSFLEEAPFEIKDRTKGIVAAAIYLKALYPHVRILTNSYEVERFAKIQKYPGIKVDYERVKVS